jgi:hypothetical protein
VTVSYKNIFKFSDNSFAVKNLPLTPLTELYTLEDIVFPFDKYIYSSGIDDDSETYVEITDGSYEFVKNKDDTVDLHLYFSGLVDGASEILFTINEYNSPAYSGVLKINGETIVPNLPPGKYTFSL